MATLDLFPQVSRLSSPLAAGNEGQISADRHAALVTFSPKGSYEEAAKDIDHITGAVAKIDARHPDFFVGEAGSTSTGKALDEMFGSQLARAGMISIPLTLVVLLAVFGSLVGALVPLLLALSSVGAAIGLVALPSHIVPMDESVAEVILLIGLAVGVDYSLFYIRRERDERRAGRDATAALEAAAATSGRAVLISGFTVMIAMAGMLLSGDKTFISFAVGTIIVVAVAMLGSLTVLPAVLSKLGDRIERGRVPFVGKRLARTRGESRIWGAVLDRVLRRPVLSQRSAATAVLLALAFPALHLHTAVSGLGSLPKSIDRGAVAQPRAGSLPRRRRAGRRRDPRRRDRPGRPAARWRSSSARRSPRARRSSRSRSSVAPSGHAIRVLVPLVGKGTDDRSNRALAMLREEIVPATVGALPDAEVAVTGATAALASTGAR